MNELPAKEKDSAKLNKNIPPQNQQNVKSNLPPQNSNIKQKV